MAVSLAPSVDKDVSVTEALQFLYDVIRLQKCSALDSRWWSREDSDWATVVSSFRSQSIVRLIDNVVRDHQSSGLADSLSRIDDIIEIVKKSLNDRIQVLVDEGLLDCILPYVSPLPSNFTEDEPQQPRPTAKSPQATPTPLVCVDQAETSQPPPAIPSTNVIIHVIDDVLGSQEDFHCPASILLQKMPYFASATKGQNLCDVDITVHCDVNIFHWLVKWMNSSADQTRRPNMEVTKVVPILLSAAFLEMDVLVEDCLDYCHASINQILDSKQSLSCLNDSLMERLCIKFTLAEVESLGEKRTSVHSRFYPILITDLCAGQIQPRRGIFRTASTLYRCQLCENLLTDSVHLKVPCVEGRYILNTTGQVFYHHVRDPAWDLNEYVKALKNDLKTWRKVFWRLWSQSHFLQCSQCRLPYSASQMDGCRYHLDNPAYSATARSKTTLLPVGKYPCCQQTAYRFSIVPAQNGCRYKEHICSCVDEEQVAVMELCHQFRDLICPVKTTPIACRVTQMSAPSEEDLVARFTLGFNSRPRMHLVPLPWQEEETKRSGGHQSAGIGGASGIHLERQSTSSVSSSNSSNESDVTAKLLEPFCYQDEDVAEDETDEESSAAKAKHSPRMRDCSRSNYGRPVTGIRTKFAARREPKCKPQPIQKEIDLRWNTSVPNRTNQENQSCMEEEIFEQMMVQLGSRRWQTPAFPVGGLFHQIQVSWQERSLRQARLAKLGTTRSAVAAAMAAKKFKSKLSANQS